MNYSTINETRRTTLHKKNKAFDHQSRKAIRLIFISVIVFAGVLFGAMIQAWANHDEASAAHNSDYPFVIVESGDTLWSIASDYAPADANLQKFIYKLKRLNHLESSRLEVGQQLLLPDLK